MAEIICLDARCMGEAQAHGYLARKLSLPEYYGGNLDALYDCLTELPETLLVVEHTAEAEPYFLRVRQVLRDAEEEHPDLTVRFYEQSCPTTPVPD